MVELVRAGRTDAAKCLALGADAVMVGTAARHLEDYEALGTSPARRSAWPGS